MIGILGGMGTQAGLDFCNKLAMINRGKIDQEYPLFILYNKSDIPGRPESISIHAKNSSDKLGKPRNIKKYKKVLTSLVAGCRSLEKSKCKFCEHIRTACRKIGKTPNKAIENVTMAKLWLLDVKRDANKTDANIAAFNDNVP